MVVREVPQPRKAVVGTFLVPAGDEEGINVQQLIGAVDVLTAFVREHGLCVEGVEEEADVVVNDGGSRRRGRKPGSTNWSQERFWRKYRKAAAELRRPYRGTHLAANMGVVYTTFRNYMNRFGPPPDCAAPGD